MKIARESWALGAILMADTLITAWLVAHGKASEANPVMKYYFSMGTVGFMVAKTLFTFATICVLELLRARRPKTIKFAERLVIVLYLLFYAVGSLRVNAANAAVDTDRTPTALSMHP